MVTTSQWSGQVTPPCGAAIAAREQGARVVALEKAPEYFRGGNTYFTGGVIRCAYNGIDDIKALVPDMSLEEEQSVDVGRYSRRSSTAT